MASVEQLSAWNAILAVRLPSLSGPVRRALADWSFGVAVLRLWSLPAVALFLAALTALAGGAGRLPNNRDRRYHATRQRLREFYLPANRKRGKKRRAIEPDAVFADLLRWVTDGWAAGRLALALDATHIDNRFVSLTVSVLYKGSALPVAWRILAADQKGAWHEVWVTLLGHLKAAVPDGWRVLVLTDRGLESAALFRVIQGLGWHPLMRVKNQCGTFRPTGWQRAHRFTLFARRPGDRFAATGMAYPSADPPLACTFLADWTPGHAEAWCLVTDLDPADVSACFYAWRMWIEHGFKWIKSGLLGWDQTRLADADRANRTWLVVAVTLLKLVQIDGLWADHPGPAETVPPLTDRPPLPAASATPDTPPVPRPRLFSAARRGWLALLVGLLLGQAIPTGPLPEPDWPRPDPHPATPDEATVDALPPPPACGTPNTQTHTPPTNSS